MYAPSLNDFELVADLSKVNRYTGSRRFNSYRIKGRSGVEYSFKQALEDASKPMLANEVAFNRYIATTNAGLSAPEVISYSDDTAIFEWIDSPLLVEESYRGPLSRDQVSSIVSVLMSLRSMGTSGFEGIRPETPAGQLDVQFDAWTAAPLKAGMLTAEQLVKARSIARGSTSKGSLQHGDLAFWHVFVGEETPIVYDTEHASSLHDEYSDFAHAYTSFFARNPDEPSIGTLAKWFASELGITQDTLFQRARPALITKATARLNDSLNDLEDEDYRTGAVRLFESILAGSLPQ